MKILILAPQEEKSAAESALEGHTIRFTNNPTLARNWALRDNYDAVVTVSHIEPGITRSVFEEDFHQLYAKRDDDLLKEGVFGLISERLFPIGILIREAAFEAETPLIVILKRFNPDEKVAAQFSNLEGKVQEFRFPDSDRATSCYFLDHKGQIQSWTQLKALLEQLSTNEPSTAFAPSELGLG